jgi:hypothetical protein
MEIHILDVIVTLAIVLFTHINLKKAGMSHYEIIPISAGLGMVLCLLFCLFDVVDIFTLIQDLIFNSKIKL